MRRLQQLVIHGLVSILGVLAILPASLLLSGSDDYSELPIAACFAEPTWAMQAVCSARYTVEGRSLPSSDIKQYLECRASYLLPLGTMTAILMSCAVCAAAVFSARRNSTLRSDWAGSMIQTQTQQVMVFFGLGLVVCLLSFPAWNSLDALFCPQCHSNVFAIVWAPVVALGLGAKSAQSPRVNQESKMNTQKTEANASFSSHSQRATKINGLQVINQAVHSGFAGLYPAAAILQSALAIIASRQKTTSLDEHNVIVLCSQSVLLLLTGGGLVLRMVQSAHVQALWKVPSACIQPLRSAVNAMPTGEVQAVLCMTSIAQLYSATTQSPLAYFATLCALPIASVVVALQRALAEESKEQTLRTRSLQKITSKGIALAAVLEASQLELLESVLTVSPKQHGAALVPVGLSSNVLVGHVPLQRFSASVAAMKKWARYAAVQVDMTPTQNIPLYDVLDQTVDCLQESTPAAAYHIQLPDFPARFLHARVDVATTDWLAAVAACTARTSLGASLALKAADRVVRVQVALRVHTPSPADDSIAIPVPSLNPISNPDHEDLARQRKSDTHGQSRNPQLSSAASTLKLQLYCVISQHAHMLTQQQLVDANASRDGDMMDHLQHDSWVHVRAARRRLRLMKGDVRVVANSSGYSIVVMLPLRLPLAHSPSVVQTLSAAGVSSPSLSWQWVQVYGAVRGHAAAARWRNLGSCHAVLRCTASQRSQANRLRARCCNAVWLVPTASAAVAARESTSGSTIQASGTSSAQPSLPDAAILKTSASISASKSASGCYKSSSGEHVSLSPSPERTGHERLSSSVNSLSSPQHGRIDNAPALEPPRLQRRLSSVQVSKTQAVVLAALPATHEDSMVAPPTDLPSGFTLRNTSGMTAEAHSSASEQSSLGETLRNAAVSNVTITAVYEPTLKADRSDTAPALDNAHAPQDIIPRPRLQTLQSVRGEGSSTLSIEYGATKSTIASLHSSPLMTASARRKQHVQSQRSGLSSERLTDQDSKALADDSNMAPLELPIATGIIPHIVSGQSFQQQRAAAQAIGASPSAVVRPRESRVHQGSTSSPLVLTALRTSSLSSSTTGTGTVGASSRKLEASVSSTGGLGKRTTTVDPTRNSTSDVSPALTTQDSADTMRPYAGSASTAYRNPACSNPAVHSDSSAYERSSHSSQVDMSVSIAAVEAHPAGAKLRDSAHIDMHTKAQQLTVRQGATTGSAATTMENASVIVTSDGVPLKGFVVHSCEMERPGAATVSTHTTDSW